MFILLLVFAILFLAYWNGANDNFKGVATLYGSGTINYRNAIGLATVTTFAGSICAIFIAQGLVSSFSGKGLVPDDTANNITFLISVGLGAACTILLATRFGLPISTTHSLVGGLLGAGLMSVGTGVNLSQLGSAFFAPLLISPLLALILAALLYWLFTTLRQKFDLKKETCICVGTRRQIVPISVLVQPNSTNQIASPVLDDAGLSITLASDYECMELYSEKVAGLYIQKILDFAHICSAAIVSFARGLNDTPKIAGLLVATQALDIHLGMIAIAIAIAIGGLLNARKVAETVSNKITPLSHGQGFSANLVTGFLVIVASNFGVPVSTTHVSVGSIFGIGIISGKRDKRVMRDIVFSWMVTLPTAMCFSALIFFLVN